MFLTKKHGNILLSLEFNSLEDLRLSRFHETNGEANSHIHWETFLNQAIKSSCLYPIFLGFTGWPQKNVLKV